MLGVSNPLFGEPDPPKAQNKYPEWVAAITGCLALLVSLITGAVGVPWLKWVAMGLAAVAILILVGLAWNKWITPYFVRRRNLRRLRRKVTQLPDYVNKFIGAVVQDNYTDSILYNVRSIHALPNGETFNGQERTDSGRFLRELSEALVARFAEKPRTLAEIKLVFSTFDKIVFQFGTMYSAWRNDLIVHWNQLSDHAQTGLVKSSGLYIKFVDDYANYRKSGETDAYELGGLYLPVPDPLPGVSPKPPAVAPTKQA